MVICRSAKLSYRDQLRDARAVALQDAEGFQELLFVIERLGTALLGRAGALNGYKPKIRLLAEKSPLSFCVPTQYRAAFTPFDLLYDLVREARNDALHQGAYARHITAHAIEISIVLEDALTAEMNTISDFMVRSVSVAEGWQPLALLRQVMLSNSYSFLPYDHNGTWSLVSDQALAKALRNSAHGSERNSMLGKTLAEAVKYGKIIVESTEILAADSLINDAIELINLKPLLVQDPARPNEIIGIIAAFDLL